MEVLVLGTSSVDVRMGSIRTSTSVSVDPLQPMLSTMAGDEVLKVICDWEAQALSCSEEVNIFIKPAQSSIHSTEVWKQAPQVQLPEHSPLQPPE